MAPAISCRHSFDPEFRGLVDDDEQGFVMLAAERLLAGQEFREMQIVAIGHGILEVPMNFFASQVDGGAGRVGREVFGGGTLRSLYLP